MTIINKDAPLKVSHLLWAMGIFKVIIILGISIGIWYLENMVVKEAVKPLQTKQGFNEWKDSYKEERKEWLRDEWKPHLEGATKANTSIEILLERTDSRARNTNSVGRSGMSATPPPPQ